MLEQLYQLFLRYPVVTTDSRKVTDGSIFFALKGDNFDGNRFASTALQQGAVAAVVDDTSICTESGNYVVVTDVLTTLQQLAALHRRTLGCKVVAVTGTNGKTTTKELLNAVLSRRYNILATRGNLNNHIGVPLTLLAMDKRTEIAIVEMGASHCGEIASLCTVAAPDYGLITNIGRAHLEGFGGEEGIRRGKGELYDYLAQTGGLAFVRYEDSVLAEMVDSRPTLNTCPYPSSYGEGFRTSLEGDYNRFNIAAAVAVGRYFGVDEESIEEAVAGYTPDNHRSQHTATASNELVIDCYNANPSSMKAAIDNFGAIESDKQKVLILGDMLELGAWSRAEHRTVIEQALRSNATKIYLTGAEFGAALDGVDDRRIRSFADRNSLAAFLKRYPLRNRLVLVKASHGTGLEQIVQYL